MDECTRVGCVIFMEADDREHTVHVPVTDKAESCGLRVVCKILSITTSIRYRLGSVRLALQHDSNNTFLTRQSSS